MHTTAPDGGFLPLDKLSDDQLHYAMKLLRLLQTQSPRRVDERSFLGSAAADLEICGLANVTDTDPGFIDVELIRR